MTSKRSQLSPVGSPSISDISTKEHDRFLPIANVGRIMKKALPSNAKISKEAKETVQECVSEFISFITGEASEKCQRERRKTINGDDLLWAMTTLGFANYVGTLKVYLNKYRETEGENNTISVEKVEPISSIDYSFHHNNVNNNEFDGSFGVQIRAKGYGDQEKMTWHGNNLGKRFEHGNARGAMSTHLDHHGVEW